MARKRKLRRGWGRPVLLLLVAGLALWIGIEALTWPDVGALARRNPHTTAFIESYRERQRDAGRDDAVAWQWTPYADISSGVKRAVLVAEDINFFAHHGFDVTEMQYALEDALDDGEVPRGASTITQQLAKNLWLSASRNPLRKVKEAILTWQLERRLGKQRILELYLNVVELGPGIYGVEAAARHYFGKSAADLNDDEAAQLAASLPNPTRWHPGSASRGYRRYVERLGRRMEKVKF